MKKITPSNLIVFFKKPEVKIFFIFLSLLVAVLIVFAGIRFARERKAEALYLKADKTFSSGDFENSLKDLKEAVRLNPNDPEAHLLLARACEAKGELSLAEEEYRKAISLGSTGKDVLYSFAIVLEARGKTDKARKILEEIVKKEKGFYPAKVALARVYLRLGREKDAEKLVEELLASESIPEAEKERIKSTFNFK